MPSIAILVFPGAEELDFVGPWEVLRTWQQWWPDDGVDVILLVDAGEIECAKGMRILPGFTWADAPSIDVLIYPGGQGNLAQLGDVRLGGWLRRRRSSRGQRRTPIGWGTAPVGAVQNERPHTRRVTWQTEQSFRCGGTP